MAKLSRFVFQINVLFSTLYFQQAKTGVAYEKPTIKSFNVGI